MVLCVGINDTIDDEVDDSKGENTNDETNNAIEDSIFGFFDFGGFTRGSHVIDATNDDNHNADESKNTYYCIENLNDTFFQTRSWIGVWDWVYGKFCDNIFHFSPFAIILGLFYNDFFKNAIVHSSAYWHLPFFQV